MPDRINDGRSRETFRMRSYVRTSMNTNGNQDMTYHESHHVRLQFSDACPCSSFVVFKPPTIERKGLYTVKPAHFPLSYLSHGTMGQCPVYCEPGVYLPVKACNVHYGSTAPRPAKANGSGAVHRIRESIDRLCSPM
jgi:hypothetical protein